MLTISNLTKNYDGFTLNCTMKVLPGQVTGLIGKNGAGKSTTFKAALGLIRADGGEIQMFGKGINLLKEADRQKVGVAMSDSGFSAYFSITDITAILKNMYREFDSRQFLEKCKAFGLPSDKKIKEFSTGMKAKLRVLAAISHNASLLILDEPTVGLDVMAREEILDMLRDYMEKDENRSILISSHISSDLESLCDDFYMIDDGKIILHEETDVLLSSYAVLKVESDKWEKLDKQYILKYKKQPYGYSCLTNEKQFYMENYPDIVVEKGNIDSLISMMIGGVQV